MLRVRLAPVALLLACASDDGAAATDAPGTDASSTADAETSPPPTSDEPPSTSASTSVGTTGSGPGTSTTNDASSDSGPTGESPDDYCGAVLFAEPFEDTDFEARGWYDGSSATLSTTEHVEGSTASFECRFAPGATGCEGGTPARHLFDAQPAVCLRFFVKHSENWVGSGQPYHPHLFHFVTNEDDIYVGPAATHLTTYIEEVAGVPRLAIQDSLNVDLDCVLLNDDSFVGCDGDFDSFVFDENRSAASCNGLLGDLDGRDCFSTGSGYYSARFWDADVQAFDDTDWHEVVAYWRLNGIEGGVGVPDGVLRYWVDGELLVAHDAMFLRTGAHPDMLFDQFLVAPYIGDGSPVDQTMWVDDLEVSAGL